MSGRLFVRPFPLPSQWLLGSSYYSPVLRDVARAIPGIRFDEDDEGKGWVGYPDAIELALLDLRSRGIRVDLGSFKPEAGLRVQASNTLLVSYEGLRDYQKTGVDFLIQHAESGALLADGMRLGKSCQSLRAARALRAKTLITCPPHVVGVWGRSNDKAKRKCEVEKWWPEAYSDASVGSDFPATFIAEGIKPDADDRLKLAHAQVVIVHHDILYAWVEALIKFFNFRTLIVDECHCFQDEKSRRSKAGVLLRAHAKHTIFLSGTPMVNRPRDLFSVVNTLCPLRFGKNFFLYGTRYAAGHQETVGRGEALKTVWNFDGSSNEDELHRRLSFFMLRRTKTEVAEELPKETRQVVDLVIPRKFEAPAMEAFQSPKALRKSIDLASNGALPQAVEVVKEHVSSGSVIVVFCYRRAVAEHLSESLAKAKLPHGLVHGLIPQKKREVIIQAARDHDASRGVGHALIATIDSTSTGIDLSYASTAVYVEMPWELVDFLQSKERLYNFSSMNPIFIQILVARGTTQEIVVDRLLKKLDLFEKVVGKVGDESLKTDLLGRGGEDALSDLCKEMLKNLDSGSSKKRKTTR